MDFEEINKILDQCLDDIIKYDNPDFPYIFPFPGTTPQPIAAEVFCKFSKYHPNNIGTATNNNCEKGFGGTQKLERNLIYMLGELCGSSDPEKELDGYLCSGSTEGNTVGLWIGRNFLRNKSQIRNCG